MTFTNLPTVLADKDHIIWDWNGTLLNDVDHAVETMNHLLSKFNLPDLTKDRYRQVFEFPVINYYRALGFDFELESFESLCHQFVDRYMNGFRNLPMVSGAEQILAGLKSKSKTQTVLSATDQNSLDEMVNHFEIRHFFELTYGISNKYAGSKLERGHQLIARVGVSKEKTVLVGDTLHDLEVGHELGVDVVLVGYGHQCSKKLKQHHICVIEN